MLSPVSGQSHPYRPLSYSDLLVILDKCHWMLYFLVPAMYPRFLITLDEELNAIPVTVRVGQVCLEFFQCINLH